MVSPNTAALHDGAEAVRRSIVRTRLSLDVVGIEQIRRDRDAALAQLDDHVLPRLANLDAPALIVVGGSTGAGKSTLVNSLVGSNVTRPGVLRPTTRAPVLVCNPASVSWFADQRVLPGLARITGPNPGEAVGSHSHSELELVVTDSIATDIAILDAPDVDSVVAENRELATQLLAAADLWVFVTTAARYADAVPWDHLRLAAARGVSLVVVLNRVPPGALGEIEAHLASMMSAEGLGGVHIYGIEEQPLESGRISASALEALRGWLGRLATDSEARDRAVRRTLRGVISDICLRCDAIAEATDAQRITIDQLRGITNSAFANARADLMEDVRDGAVLRGEVLDRWQDVVGTGELIRGLESGLGRLRDRVTSAITGRPMASTKFTGAVESGVATLAYRRANEAIATTFEQWSHHSAGAQLLAGSTDNLQRPNDDLESRIATTVREWQGGLLEMLRTEGADKRSTARILSYGVNGTALVLMVAVFAQTGGLTGAEVAIAGGTSAVGTKLLEALLGDQALRRLAESARTDLDRRMAVVLEREADRFTRQLDALQLDVEAASDLRRDAHALLEAVETGGLDVEPDATSPGGMP